MVISFSRGPVFIHQAHVLLRYGKSLFTCLSFLLMCVSYIVSSCCLVLSFKCNVLYRVVVFSPFFFSARISSGFFTYDFGFSPFDCFKLKLSTLRTNLDNFSALFLLWWNHANLQYHSPKMVPIVYNLSVFSKYFGNDMVLSFIIPEDITSQYYIVTFKCFLKQII